MMSLFLLFDVGESIMQNYKKIQYEAYALCMELVFMGIVVAKYFVLEIKIRKMLRILISNLVYLDNFIYICRRI